MTDLFLIAKELLIFYSQNKGKANNLKKISKKIHLLRGLKKLFLSDQEELSDLSPLQGLSNLHTLTLEIPK